MEDLATSLSQLQQAQSQIAAAIETITNKMGSSGTLEEASLPSQAVPTQGDSKDGEQRPQLPTSPTPAGVQNNSFSSRIILTYVDYDMANLIKLTVDTVAAN